MKDTPEVLFRRAEEVLLVGTMKICGSQADASQGIPQQWSAFLSAHPELGYEANFIGASPCTNDHKIHYLTGAAGSSIDGEQLILAAGEYAVVEVSDPASLRDTWVWLLSTWLPASGRREKNAPEFERFTSISPEGKPVGPVEIWIPLND